MRNIRYRKLIKWGINIGVVLVVLKFILITVDEITQSSKIEEILGETRNLRIALEKYYQLTGKYPELTKKGANTNLYILDYVNERGEKISFAKIYGKKALPKTYGNRYISASNKVYDVEDFSKGNRKGGWNYNFSGNTGEIHPNLPENMYREKIEWNRQ